MPRKSWTPEQRKAASDRAKAALQAKKFEALPSSAVAIAEPEVIEDDDVLSQLMATLGAARAKKVRQSDALKQLAGLLDQIDPKDHPELAEDPIVAAFIDKINANRVAQAEKLGLPPGTQIGTGLAQDAIPWKYTDLPKRCVKADGSPDLITFIPNTTIQITWNGLMCQFRADEEMTTYKPFYDVYMESRRLSRVGDAHKAFMFGDSDTLPAELQSGDQAVATMRARAFMSLGPKRGGGSIIMGYGGDEKFGMREQPVGEQGVSGEIPT